MLSFRHQTVTRLLSQRREKSLSESVPSLHKALVEWRNKHFIIYYFFFFLHSTSANMEPAGLHFAAL